MSRADFDKWESRYRAASGEIGEPETFVRDVVATLPAGGLAVDVAGGTGRHGLWLAAQGWPTTIVDISPTGLARAAEVAAKAGHPLETRAADLETAEAAAALPPSTFDLVVCTWFLPGESLWRLMVDALQPGGTLVYVQPTQSNLSRHPRPSARFLFEDARLGDHLVSLGLEVVRYEEGWDGRGFHTARGCATSRARRPAVGVG